jgi:hypothetical protein
MWRRSCVLLMGASLACGGSEPPPSVSGGGNIPYGSGGSGSSSGSTGSEEGEGDDCGSVTDETQNGYLPVDILFVVDNSGSMWDEHSFVQSSMNEFSNLISAANIDAQVILISDYSICVPGPLGSGGCPMDDNNPPLYTHIDRSVQSSDALWLLSEDADLISAYNPLIRSNSIKHVVVVSDDESGKSASSFNSDFLAIDPKYAGYKFHAIVASAFPDQAPCIDLSAARGQIYINLVAQTGGVYGDLCEQDFEPVFEAIAMAVEASTPIACVWDIPDPPEGEELNPNGVEVQLTVDGQLEELEKFDSAEACGDADGWFFEPDNSNPVSVRVCPATCDIVQAADEAKVDIVFGCAPPPEQAE